MQEQYSVGIYARLSRDDERAGESVSIENQKEMLARYVREQGWTLYDYYCGRWGLRYDLRPSGFNRLVQDATDHKINLVLTKDLSRLGRDYIEAGKYTDFIFRPSDAGSLPSTMGWTPSARTMKCWSF